MDADTFTGLLTLAVMLAFASITFLLVGIRLERFRRDKEVEAFEFPEDDSTYWKKNYEELAEEYDVLREDFNQAVGPKSFPKRERNERKEAPE